MNNKQSLELYTEILSAVVLYKNELSDLTLKDLIGSNIYSPGIFGKI